MIEVLKQALAHAKLNERHQTVAESYYWLRQYKLLAEKAIAELESQEPVEPTEKIYKAWDILVGQHKDLLEENEKLRDQSQRTWVWLTDEEHQKIINAHFSAQEMLIAAETKSKEKNT